ncbi:MAG: hypothetical protein OZ913_05190 [Ignavibacteriaceae bacterium]|nr:MAG: hypothetical protein EDM69_02465 [Chlorobiota bacterium]MCE7952487.1 hypothetical protein [Chlorobi bacterium CHB7]MEB2329678.1 hypothetical protein [Ignavibacteriaceae bacterium]OQY77296.1 MAG: hypothetical protein B6D43_06715 [Ignavibacteriales bacterium UTCHB1]RIK49048.1 MAG: hypothetical protein DCC60_05595 [Ignavibacteriota bacterium]
MCKKTEILLFVSLIFLVGSCGLFDTRSVEPPSDPRSNYSPPTSPDIVLTNLQFAIAEKNLNNYISCFSDSVLTGKVFHFVADLSTNAQYPILSNWNFQQEKIYYTNLISQTDIQSSSNLFLSNPQAITTPDSVIYDADYVLVYFHNDPSVAKNFNGKLRFTMFQDSRNLWSITRWQDFKNDSGDTTWSELKAAFVN